MRQNIPDNFLLSAEVAAALNQNQPLVALESTVITHGLPYPVNLSLARDMEKEVRSQGAVPATIGLMDGKVHIGLLDAELERIATAGKDIRKVSRRDFGIALARHEMGGTTVAGTLFAAYRVGLRVMATGGIGGVHRGAAFDISSDLIELNHTPMIVVCAGAKAILDLPATVEMLETMGVPIIGYQTDEMPAFYSASSGLPVTESVMTPREIAEIARSHWEAGLASAILVVVPPPAETAIPAELIEQAIRQALDESHQLHITGAKVTPFLLQRVSE
ncbi:MAG: pseudouridine-5'-phosphate glycosidase, partial [Planctomycetes bacterium]|nr:pseudouridine-5'-phosphate glycosidase [Planctomycetota bacterium]